MFVFATMIENIIAAVFRGVNSRRICFVFAGQILKLWLTIPLKAASLVSGSGSRCGCVSNMNARLLSSVSQIVLSLTNLSYCG